MQQLQCRMLQSLSEVRGCPKCFTAARHPAFDVMQNRREVEHGRLQCAVLLYTARRVSALRNETIPCGGHCRENIRMRADRGQRAAQLCFCGDETVSGTIMRPSEAVA
jgi:hypothetical protein